MLTIQIRGEEAADSARISQLTAAAFRGAAHTCGREHLLVDALRAAGALTLSLVAVADGQLVGHVAVSPASVTEATGEWFGFGPLSVLPACQRQGIGSRLMEAALAQLRGRGARGCVLVGDPDYYRRFGFQSEAALLVSGVPPEVSLSLRFAPSPDRGEVTFHAAFAAALG
jgi:predicted N-acetyltransferase YhbS